MPGRFIHLIPQPYSGISKTSIACSLESPIFFIRASMECRMLFSRPKVPPGHRNPTASSHSPPCGGQLFSSLIFRHSNQNIKNLSKPLLYFHFPQADIQKYKISAALPVCLRLIKKPEHIPIFLIHGKLFQLLLRRVKHKITPLLLSVVILLPRHHITKLL